MILQLYILTVTVAMMTTMLYKLMAMTGVIMVDQVSALQQIREMIDEYPQLEKVVDFAFNNPGVYCLMLCLLPIFNIILIITMIKNIVKGMNK